MAKGKKSSGKNYTSKGERISSIKTAGSWTKADRMLFKMKALAKGKDVTFTFANPDKTQTNKQFIKVKVSGKAWVKQMGGAH